MGSHGEEPNGDGPEDLAERWDKSPVLTVCGVKLTGYE